MKQAIKLWPAAVNKVAVGGMHRKLQQRALVRVSFPTTHLRLLFWAEASCSNLIFFPVPVLFWAHHLSNSPSNSFWLKNRQLWNLCTLLVSSLPAFQKSKQNGLITWKVIQAFLSAAAWNRGGEDCGSASAVMLSHLIANILSLAFDS